MFPRFVYRFGMTGLVETKAGAFIQRKALSRHPERRVKPVVELRSSAARRDWGWALFYEHPTNLSSRENLLHGEKPNIVRGISSLEPPANSDFLVGIAFPGEAIFCGSFLYLSLKAV